MCIVRLGEEAEETDGVVEAIGTALAEPTRVLAVPSFVGLVGCDKSRSWWGPEGVQTSPFRTQSRGGGGDEDRERKKLGFVRILVLSFRFPFSHALLCTNLFSLLCA